MTPFPTTFPDDSVTMLLPILRGQMPPDKKAACCAAWNIIGYGLAVGVPAAPTVTLSHREIADHLERALLSRVLSTAGSFPWQQIIATLVPLIMQWLSSSSA